MLLHILMSARSAVITAGHVAAHTDVCAVCSDYCWSCAAHTDVCTVCRVITAGHVAEHTDVCAVCSDYYWSCCCTYWCLHCVQSDYSWSCRCTYWCLHGVQWLLLIMCCTYWCLHCVQWLLLVTLMHILMSAQSAVITAGHVAAHTDVCTMCRVITAGNVAAHTDVCTVCRVITAGHVLHILISALCAEWLQLVMCCTYWCLHCVQSDYSWSRCSRWIQSERKRSVSNVEASNYWKYRQVKVHTHVHTLCLRFDNSTAGHADTGRVTEVATNPCHTGQDLIATPRRGPPHQTRSGRGVGGMRWGRGCCYWPSASPTRLKTHRQ